MRKIRPSTPATLAVWSALGAFVAWAPTAAAQNRGATPTTPTTTPTTPTKPAGAPATPTGATGAATTTATGTATTTTATTTTTTTPATGTATTTPTSARAPGTTPPPEGAPISTSGTDVLPAGEAGGDLAARVKKLEAQVAADEKRAREHAEKTSWLRWVRISGYVQPQLVWNWFNDAASPNTVGGVLPPGVGANVTTAKADGTTSNTDVFRLRRARLKMELAPNEHAKLVFEIDPTPAGGPSGGTGTIARNVEAVGIVDWTKDVETEFGVGIFKIPFGYEVLQSDADRPFIERSWGERNLTPGEYDTGARAYTRLLDRQLHVQLAVVNGAMQGEKTFSVVPDLNQSKDFVGRVHLDFGSLTAGVSGYSGTGQTVMASLLRFKQFSRWAVNVETSLAHEFSKKIGPTRLFAELTLGQDMDRGVNYAFAVPAIPPDVTVGVAKLDERAVFVRLEQDITPWATVGVRYDFYSPDTAQKNNGRDTYSFVGVVHFTKGLQLMLEDDYAIDNVHASGTPAPSKHIDTFSAVLQARF